MCCFARIDHGLEPMTCDNLSWSRSLTGSHKESWDGTQQQALHGMMGATRQPREGVSTISMDPALITGISALAGSTLFAGLAGKKGNFFFFFGAPLI